MTRIKLCGLTRPEDIAAANALQPEYIGFVFAPKSRRYVSRELAAELKAQLSPGIQAVGVFVNEAPETVAGLLNAGVIDIAQLHGQEDAAYLARLRSLNARPLWQAFRVTDARKPCKGGKSPADLVLLDSRRRRNRAGPLTGRCWKISSGIIFLPEGLARKMRPMLWSVCTPMRWM